MDCQETIVLKIKEREKAIYLLPTDPKVYNGLLTHHRRGTNGHGEPSEMVSRLDLVVLELAAAGLVFLRLPRGFLEIWGFIELKGGGTEVGVGQHTPGRAWASWRGQVGVAHPGFRL